MNVLVSFPVQAAPRCLPPACLSAQRPGEELLSSDMMQEQAMSRCLALSGSVLVTQWPAQALPGPLGLSAAQEQPFALLL